MAKECQLEIVNQTGLHTRPAKLVVDQAKKYVCDITISKGEKSANLKSMIKLMKVGISRGDKVTLRCEGEDEEAALADLAGFIENLSE